MRRGRLPAVLLLAALVVLAGGGLQESRGAGMQALRGHVPEVVRRLKRVERLDGRQELDLAIALPLRNEAGLTDLLKELYDPGDANYHHYLTTAEFTARFGPTQGDYEAVASFATAHGLRVTERHANRLIVDVTGAVSDIEKTLHVRMGVYKHPTEGRTFYAPDAEPTVELAVPIAHISGLDDYALPRPRFHYMTKSAMAAAAARVGAGGKGNTGSAPNGVGYMGNDFRAAYAPGVTATGTGQVVGLLQFDGYTAGDITTYESEAGLPNVPLTNVTLDRFNGQPTGNGGEVEVSLDIEMVISMAPGLADVIVYEAGPRGRWHDILNRMVSDNKAKQIGCSWYIPNGGADSTAEGIFMEMAAQGQSFFSASGDSDAFTGLIPFPGDSPNITQVGGTMLTSSGPGGTWVSEQAWNRDNGVGTGGGISTQYGIPVWQAGISMGTNQGSTTMRNVPDVALTAENVYVRVDGADEYVGGTSCAAPLWAGFTALINQQGAANHNTTVGFMNPALYTLAESSLYGAVFHDTTTGDNTSSGSPSAFYAVAGYDLCTGLGTPMGQALIDALTVPTEGLNVSPGNGLAASGTEGGTFAPGSASYQLTNADTGQLGWTASVTQSWLTLSVTSGTLNANLSGTTTVTATINANAKALASGTYSDTITFADALTGYTLTRPVSLTVVPRAPVITSALMATATAGMGFSYQIEATNGATSYGASGLPAGLTMDPVAGLISGTATATGTSSVGLSASNAGGTGTATLTLTVVPAPPVITSGLSATGTSGVGFSYQIGATNAATSYGASGLPAGLTVDAVAGVISGTATATGTSSVALSAINAGGTGTATLTLTVVPAPPVITSGLSATGTGGAAFSYQIAATNGATAYGANGLPAGLAVNGQTGLITGTTGVTGTSVVTISAANVSGSGVATLSVVITPTPYEAWQSGVFTALDLQDPTISGDTAEPAGDGIPNLLKYALGLNPKSDGAGGLPVAGMATTGSGSYLTLTYTQVIAATDISYTVQVSTDLQTWNSGAGYTDPPVATPNGDGVTESVTVQAAAPEGGGGPGQFMRLEVTGP